MFLTVVSFGSQHDILGLATANIDVRAFTDKLYQPWPMTTSVVPENTKNAGYVILKKSYHDLMKNGPGVVIHFVELINTTYSIITQHKSTTTNKEHCTI